MAGRVADTAAPPGDLMMILRLLLATVVLGGLAWADSTPRMMVRILDARTGQPVAGVNVITADSANAAISDGEGAFSVEADLPSVRLSAIGYQSHWLRFQESVNGRHATPTHPVTDTLLVWLEPRVIEMADEILIEGDRVDQARAPSPGQRASGSVTTTAALDGVGGVSLVRRSNFGAEPTIRGTQPGQVGVVIEGMKVFHACVDRMDPVTSYVETENLQRLEVVRGGFDLTHASSVGGVINLVTQKPQFAEPISGHTQLGFESAAQHRFSRNVLQLSRGEYAARGSFSYRRAGDMSVGGRHGNAGNTQFAKYNYKLDVTRRGDRHQFEIGILADEAWDVGYPALLMDARRADSRLYSTVHTWSPEHRFVHSLQTKFYVSRVDHWMDDENRDVTQREVMRDMHMPMVGHTRTSGLLQTLQMATREQTLRVILDAYEVKATADMEMISILPDVAPMYLLNLGDVTRRHAAATADYQRSLSERLQARVNLRVEGVDQALADPVARRQLAASWGDESLDRRFAESSVSLKLDYQWRPATRWTLGWSRSARLPTTLESYGFFLFNPADGYFYTGKPHLRAEQSHQIEIGWEYERDRRRLHVRLYDNRMYDYIAGVVQESIFKTYENIAAARLTGGELNFALPAAHAVILHGDASYTRGHNETFDEPLPFVSPLEARIGLTHMGQRTLLEISSRLVAPQDRVAHRTTLEDETPAFVVVDLRCEIKLGSDYRVDFGIDNLFDRYYFEHLSVGNFPSMGRNVKLALDVGF